MLPDRVSNPGPLTYESGVLPIALRGPAKLLRKLLTNLNGCRKVIFCFGSLVILDVVCRYLSLFLLYINIKIDVKCKTSR